MYTKEDILEMLDKVMNRIRDGMNSDNSKEIIDKIAIAVILGFMCEFNKRDININKEVN